MKILQRSRALTSGIHTRKTGAPGRGHPSARAPREAGVPPRPAPRAPRLRPRPQDLRPCAGPCLCHPALLSFSYRFHFLNPPNDGQQNKGLPNNRVPGRERALPGAGSCPLLLPCGVSLCHWGINSPFSHRRLPATLLLEAKS